MQALIFHNGRFEMTDVSAPHPASAEAVLVDVEFISLNRGETTVPWGQDEVIGWDACGTVAQTSADGHGPAVGTRVVTWGYSGAWAQNRMVSHRNLAIVPSGITGATAAALPVAGLTALHAVKAAAVASGSRIAITGATGGVGHLAVQLAANTGAHVLAITRDPHRAAALNDAFAGKNITVATVEQAKQEKIDVIIDTVGGPILATLLDKLSGGGRVILVGAASAQSTEIDTATLIAKHINLLSVVIPTPVGGDLATLLELVRLGQLTVNTVDGGAWTRLTSQVPAGALGLGKTVFYVTDLEAETIRKL
ncbi:zinc-binding dehydrogenase [Klebsiella pneumoniae]